MAQQTLIPDDYLTRGLSDLAQDYSPVEVIEAARALWPDLATHGPSVTPARLTDRQTSQDAARKHETADVSLFRAGSLRHSVLAAYGAIGITGVATANCVAVVVADPLGRGNTTSTESARKRVNELEKAGYLKAEGTTIEEGSERTLYRITSAGLVALDRLARTGWSREKHATQATDYAGASA